MKKSRPARPAMVEQRQDVPMTAAEPTPSHATSVASVSSFDDLQALREQASQRRSNTAHVIAELVEWRSEIDATIAFLRAQEK